MASEAPEVPAHSSGNADTVAAKALAEPTKPSATTSPTCGCCFTEVVDAMRNTVSTRNVELKALEVRLQDEVPPTYARLRFLTRWARVQLSLVEMRSFRAEQGQFAQESKQRPIVFHVFAVAAPWGLRMRSGSQDVEDARRHAALLLRFLGKAGIMDTMKAINEYSAEQFSHPAGSESQEVDDLLSIWHGRVLPTLAALKFYKDSDGNGAGTDVLDLAKWSETFLAENPMRAKTTLFKTLARKAVPGRGFSMDSVASFKSCMSDSSGHEEPPSGAEHEHEVDSESDEEGDKMFSSFLSARGGSGLFGQLLASFSGPGAPSDWEFQRGSEEHGWDEADATSISVRGPTYFKDKVKVNSQESLFEVVHVDLFDVEQMGGYPSISEETTGVVQELRKAGETRYLFVVNFCMPPLQVAVVFAARNSQVGETGFPAGDGDPSNALLREFVDVMSDKERSARFKVIPWVREGPWIVQKAVGRTPAIIGKSLKVAYFQKKEDYFEVSVDIFSSSAAQRILGLLKGAAKALTMEVFFVLEAKAPEELPERILGGFRVSHGDLARTRGPI